MEDISHFINDSAYHFQNLKNLNAMKNSINSGKKLSGIFEHIGSQTMWSNCCRLVTDEEQNKGKAKWRKEQFVSISCVAVLYVNSLSLSLGESAPLPWQLYSYKFNY